MGLTCFARRTHIAFPASTCTIVVLRSLEKGSEIMKLIDHGYCSASAYWERVCTARENSTFRYILWDTGGNASGGSRIGGSVSYKIYGTNDVRDVLDPKIFRNYGIFDRQENVEMKSQDLALRYIGTLNEEKKQALLLEMMVHHLTQK